MELAYERRGAGSPLVLLHDVGHHWRAWLPVLDLLAERHDVIAVDFPGFGASPPLPPGVPYTVETLASAVEAFWTSLGIEEPHVAGHSLGGYVALEQASRGVVRTAVALSPIAFWSRVEHLYARTVLRLVRASATAASDEMVVALAPSVLGLLVTHPGRFSREEILAARDALRDSAGFDDILDSFSWLAPPPPPKVPITIGWGDHDRLLLRRQAVRAGRCSQQRVKLLRGCGHIPMSDDPELVARVILNATSGFGR